MFDIASWLTAALAAGSGWLLAAIVIAWFVIVAWRERHGRTR